MEKSLLSAYLDCIFLMFQDVLVEFYVGKGSFVIRHKAIGGS